MPLPIFMPMLLVVPIAVFGIAPMPEARPVDSGPTTQAVSGVPPARDTALPAPLPLSQKKPADSTAKKDSFSVQSGVIVGFGLGLSLGGFRPFSLWKSGLPLSLADCRLTAASPGIASDSAPLLFAVVRAPDVYNMTFPVSLSLTRLRRSDRLTISCSFSWQSREYNAAITVRNDSLRRLDMKQAMRFYAVSLDFLYGRSIDSRYFSINKFDRTDVFIGLSVTPLLLLKKVATITAPPADPRLSAVGNMLAATQNGFSASGLAVGWRLGIMTLRRLSRTGGYESSLSWCGSWQTRFKTSAGPLKEQDISPKGSGSEDGYSYLLNRFEISFSLVRKVSK